MSVVSADIEPLTFVFEDDGLVPNNPMPFLVYKAAVDVKNDHPEKTIEGLFGANGWGAMWRNGVYDFLHYHATVHEALGVARGHARVRFGGDQRQGIGDFRRRCRDPAGRHRASAHVGQSRIFAWSAPIRRDRQWIWCGRHQRPMRKALKTIPQVKVPKTDPVLGADGPLVRLWTP